jgi:low affinity Fe/Cu permease
MEEMKNRLNESGTISSPERNLIRIVVIVLLAWAVFWISGGLLKSIGAGWIVDYGPGVVALVLLCVVFFMAVKNRKRLRRK